MADEVALFVDLENVVYSLMNTQKREPNPRDWVKSARNYGPVTFARAYADFSQEVMARLRSRLDVAGIDTFSCPVKVRDDRSQSTVDINLAVDLFEVALDRPEVKTFILMAGDRDYIRIVTRLQNRWSKTIVVSGVPGTVSRDLAAAADIVEPIEVSAANFNEFDLIQIIHRFECSLTNGFVPTFMRMKDYAAHPANAEVIDPNVVWSALSDFVGRGVLVQEHVTLPDGRELKATRLNREDPTVRQALGETPA
ncbi:MAG TPA: NYN domain-containing protein [Thermomicrobiaceae bacterium]|nr:NYN domain-containing protein [Thermomicrobiaceae bacterium]